MTLLKWKPDSLHILIIFLLGSLWACSVRNFNYPWKNPVLAGTRLCLGKHDHSWPHLHNTTWPTPSCLRGSCMPYFHSESVHLPFPTSVFFCYTLLGEVLSKCHSIHVQTSLTAHFPWTAKEQKSLTQDFVWIHDIGQESIPSSLQGWTTRHFLSSYCD